MTLVLVIDDDPTTRALCRVHLTHAGYLVQTAETCTEALHLLATVRPSLILMDWLMPQQTGLAMLAELQALPALADIPVVFLTGKSIAEDRERAMDAGAVGYLVKPCRSAELLAAVKRVLGG